MITRISKKLANYYIKKMTIDESEREVYEYCFDILVSTILNVLAVIVLGIVSMKPIGLFTFLIFFVFLRRYCAGAHAKTHTGCFLALMFTVGILILVQYFFSNTIHYIGIGLGVMSVVIIMLLAPADCKKKYYRA